MRWIVLIGGFGWTCLVGFCEVCLPGAEGSVYDLPFIVAAHLPFVLTAFTLACIRGSARRRAERRLRSG